MSDTSIEKLLANPALPVLGGLILALEGPDDIQLRSLALLVFVFWLVADVGRIVYCSKKSSFYRYMIFCSLFQLLLVFQLWLMGHWIETQLNTERMDVDKNLSSEAILIDNKHPLTTRFGIRNLSSNYIVLQKISCLVVRINGEGQMDTDEIETLFNPPALIRYGGGARTEQWINIVNEFNGIYCAEIVVTPYYVLQTEPEMTETKEFRWIGKKEGDGWGWILTDSANDGCSNPKPPSP
jgi:hypothetical protein